MQDVFIPDNPAERTYSCPGCNRGVIAKRIGGEGSCSYLIEHTDEKKGSGKSEDGEGKCKYKGPIDRKLVGYRPPKVKSEPEPEKQA